MESDKVKTSFKTMYNKVRYDIYATRRLDPVECEKIVDKYLEEHPEIVPVDGGSYVINLKE